MSISNVKEKDPGDTDSFKFNWGDLLDTGETIVDHSITTSSSGITYVTSSITSGCVTVVLSGGTAEQRYGVTCQITTSSSPARVLERTMKIDVRNL